MNEMRSRLDTVKNELSRIEGKVEVVDQELQENVNQTTSELVGLQNSLEVSLTSLTGKFESQLASIDAKVKKQHGDFESQLKNNLTYSLNKINLKLDLLSIHQDRLDAKVTLVNSEVEKNILTNVTEGLKTYSFGSPTQPPLQFNATLNKRFTAIELLLDKHIDETTVLLAEIDSPSHEQITKTLLSVNSSLADHVSCIKEELNGLDDSVNTIINELKNLTGDECVPGGYTCGGEGGWRRVVYLNMSDPTTSCPSGWQLGSYSRRSCGKVSFGSLTCDSAFFPVTGGEYTKVCGKIRGYQNSRTDAFEAFDNGQATTIDSAYVSGVSLTHGSPGSRAHIWTFAAGTSEAEPTADDSCPCDATISIDIPPFVGGDYFCESGSNFGSPSGFYPDDPLWDGQDCVSTSTCCSMNNPPYFTKQLSSPTTGDIEARICQWDSSDDTPIDLIELYIKGPNDGDSPCVSKTDVISSKLDSVSAVLTEEHQETRDELEEHVNHVNSELVGLQINQDNINVKLDSLESQQGDLSTKVTSVSSELQDTKDMLIDYVLSVCLGSGELPDFTIPDSGYTCGGEGGWRRVVYLDMTDPTTSCPSGWQLGPYSKRSCGRVSSGSLTCDSVFFPVTGGSYNKVCGKIRGYQNSRTDAFEAYDDGQVTTIDGAYVSGVSLTHGSPGSRAHIWTFAAGTSEAEPTAEDSCPCDATISISIPPFVGGDYFCESGSNFGSPSGFYPDDPLWDGRNCTSSSTCCSFNNPPDFTKQLSPTTNDIEARICWWESNDDTPVDLIELYVKDDRPTPPPPPRQCGGPGWRRVVNLDMTNPFTSCPSGWQLGPYSRRSCGKVSSGSLTCDSTIFPVAGGSYNRVCGKIRGYQNSQTDAFETYHLGTVTDIDGAYVAGVSLTHGSPGSRQHIWSFAAGASQDRPTWTDACPCDASFTINVPPFVGGDYFCESAAFGSPSGFYPNDPLWDGMNCTSTSTCCSMNNPPYFEKILPSPTSDSIEARICQWDPSDDTPIDMIELYVM